MDIIIGTRVLGFVGFRMGATFDGVSEVCGRVKWIDGLVGGICMLGIGTGLVTIISGNVGVFLLAILGSLGIVGSVGL